MRNPPATAPPMPIAMSINGPYPLPLRIFPADQPATKPTSIHDRKYIHFSLNESMNYLPQIVYYIPVFRKNLLVNRTARRTHKDTNYRSRFFLATVLPRTTRDLPCGARLQSFRRLAD